MQYLNAEARREWRSHWRVVVGASLGMASCYAVFPFVASLLVQPLQQEFGWTRGQQALSHYANIAAALLAPFMGAYVDKVGVRRVLLPAILLVTLCYVALANLTPSILHYYLAMGALVLIGMATTGLSFTRAVTGWFDASRGLALAVSRFGLAIAGAILPMVVYAAIQRFGYAGGFYAMAAVTLLVGFPVSWFLVVDRRPDADSRGGSRAGAPPPGWRLWPTLLRNRRILLLCLAAGLTYGPAVGILSQLQPLLVAKGLEPDVAAGLLSLLAISTFLGTAVTGALIDRVWAPALGFVFTLGPVAGCAMLLVPAAPGVPMAAAAIVLIGLAQGAEIDLAGFLIARYFGMRAFAAIYGLTVLSIGVCASLGAILIGQIYDRFHSYDLALAVGGVGFLIAALTYPLLGRYPAHPDIDALPEDRKIGAQATVPPG